LFVIESFFLILPAKIMRKYKKMKKVILVLVAVAMLSLTSQAQIKFGAKTGMNLSRFTEEQWEIKPGFHAGAYAQINIMPKFSLQADLMYSMQGGIRYYHIPLYFFSSDTYTKIYEKLHYVLIPVTFQCTPIKYLTIEAGPQFGFALKSSCFYQEFFKGVEDTERSREYILDREYYNPFDIGLVAGLKFNITKNINIYARYVIGVTDVFTLNEYARNQNIMFGVGYTF
jgi:hypothetical protein